MLKTFLKKIFFLVALLALTSYPVICEELKTLDIDINKILTIQNNKSESIEIKEVFKLFNEQNQYVIFPIEFKFKRQTYRFVLKKTSLNEAELLVLFENKIINIMNIKIEDHEQSFFWDKKEKRFNFGSRYNEFSYSTNQFSLLTNYFISTTITGGSPDSGYTEETNWVHDPRLNKNLNFDEIQNKSDEFINIDTPTDPGLGNNIFLIKEFFFQVNLGLNQEELYLAITNLTNTKTKKINITSKFKNIYFYLLFQSYLIENPYFEKIQVSEKENLNSNYYTFPSNITPEESALWIDNWNKKNEKERQKMLIESLEKVIKKHNKFPNNFYLAVRSVVSLRHFEGGEYVRDIVFKKEKEQFEKLFNIKYETVHPAEIELYQFD